MPACHKICQNDCYLNREETEGNRLFLTIFNTLCHSIHFFKEKSVSFDLEEGSKTLSTIKDLFLTMSSNFYETYEERITTS